CVVRADTSSGAQGAAGPPGEGAGRGPRSRGAGPGGHGAGRVWWGGTTGRAVAERAIHRRPGAGKSLGGDGRGAGAGRQREVAGEMGQRTDQAQAGRATSEDVVQGLLALGRTSGTTRPGDERSGGADRRLSGRGEVVAGGPFGPTSVDALRRRG